MASDILDISARLRLEPLAQSHAAALFACVEQNRSHLRRWLAWLDSTTSAAHIDAFIASEVDKRRLQSAATYAVFCDDGLCGAAGFRTLDKAIGVGELGYWLAENHTGKGLMTEVAARLVRHGFDTLALQRIEIHCATENLPSRRVAESLGARLLHIQKHAALLYDHYVDHAIYVLDNPGSEH
ncbi:GNAT family N-acetyltransferase [Congregibacter variabilis]|uniref:GNAT family N-acetyltransferase n=1 Tax=Congregibacter variabilis TaxID=3081200 RepID=A0ABZ0I5R6_9GAMM|nr:GNAT family N-acetyltransferase [Congregibacter sp. IMCC43200]